MAQKLPKMAQNYPNGPKMTPGFTHFFRNFFLTEKAVPQIFSLLECMLKASSRSSLLVLPSVILARYFHIFISIPSLSYLFPLLIQITSHLNSCVFLPHTCDLFYFYFYFIFIFNMVLHFSKTKYGRGLHINSLCFISHPFWP